ncbi:hypothetical protein I8748_28475 [Nostoc sp. CENA67]|uniref:Uncharacterized protein n=1 Tax=Amazonocrinis nigriterrae CENA67 TaxID=2794033 RepID=A0A8J7HUL3_9NOST|nr:hypothetical protein [Amazonocrinis nigriterrae]MBH8566052.1 hypothetical protein [Amazonocrinis nigriterrae CENA67]
MNKILATAVVLLGLITSGVAVAETQNHPVHPRPNFEPLSKPETVSTPTSNYSRYPDNSNKTEAQLIKKERIIKGLKKGLQLKQIKLLKYSEYLTNRKELGGSILENLMVHPNRLVWVAEIEAPEGSLEVRQSNGQNVKFKTSKVFLVVDAETGEHLDTDIFEVP